MKDKKLQIGVIGSAGLNEYRYKKPSSLVYQIARRVGRLIGESGNILFCGGKSGIMSTAALGAKSVGGTTIGIVKGNKRRVANRYIDIEIVTNALTGADVSPLILSCDGIIVIGGGAGTLGEMTVAYRNKIPMVAIPSTGGYASRFAGKYMDERKTIKIGKAANPKDALKLLFKLTK